MNKSNSGDLSFLDTGKVSEVFKPQATNPFAPSATGALFAAQTQTQPRQEQDCLGMFRKKPKVESQRQTTQTSSSTQEDSFMSQMKNGFTAPLLTPQRVIGHGAFGYVFEAYDQHRDCKVALKRTQKAGNIISREFEILDMLRGKPYIVQLLDFFYSMDEKDRLIQNTVLEYCEESMEDVLRDLDKNRTYLPMPKIKKYIRQVFQGLAAMHELGICHRDLKPENILLKEDEVRICDVGSSKVLDNTKSRMNTPYVVSRYYRAPELIMGSNKYDSSIDIWATGCILFELLTKTPMFPGDSEGIQIIEMQQILGPPSKTALEFYQTRLLEPNISALFKKAISIDSNAPVDLFQLLCCSSAFHKDGLYKEDDLRGAAALIEKCLKWVPQQRPTAAEAAEDQFLK